jgi:hypothetical protein
MKNLRAKPFPLLYEEIFLKALAKKSQSEIDLKKYIADQVKTIQPNPIHQRIINSGHKDIITTNYEYSLQSSANSKKLKNDGYVKETTYSIFRHNQVGDTRIWHIHGECNSARSITLGFEHYGGMLQHMRNYVATGTDYVKGKNLEPLILRLERNKLKGHSWIDLFFTNDIHIFGLSLDTSEIDIWWLLTYRARYALQKGRKIIQNKIYYYYPTSYKEISREKLELLSANQIQIIEIKSTNDDRLKYYNTILDKI